MSEMPRDLQRKLEEYNRNFEEINRFLGPDSILEAGAKSELQAEKTREMLTQALPVAVRTLIELCAAAESETVRYKAAVAIVDKTLGRDPTLAEEDKASALLKRLQADPVIDGSDEPIL
jgi:hypothetical protein